MIGETLTREIVDWEKLEAGDEPVYEIEYSEPVSKPVVRRPPLFGPSGGGTVPSGELTVTLPDGETVPAAELFFEYDGTTLRVRHGDPSLFTRLRRRWLSRSW